MVEKVKKLVIEPLIQTETIDLPCKSKITIEVISHPTEIIIISTTADCRPRTDKDEGGCVAIRRESFKPLIKLLQRAEKTFQKR